MTIRIQSAVFFLFIVGLLSYSASSVYGTEAATGRPLTGLQVMPYAGIIPPGPEWIISVIPFYYSGSIEATRQVPIAGRLALGLDADLSFNMFTGVYVWGTKPGRWNFASAVSVPFVYTKASAQVILGNLNVRQEDDVTSIFDMVIVPVTTSYHFSQLEHLSFNLTIWAPTGDYEVGRLANNGMNVWTYVPTVSFTKIMPKPNVEFTTTGTIGFYTENPDTDYKSGVLSSLDALVMKRYKNGFGIGGVFGWIQQLSDDEGGIADRLDGFRGRSFGIGPNLIYSKKLSEHSNMDLQFRWIPEFAAKNRAEGNVFLFSAQFVL